MCWHSNSIIFCQFLLVETVKGMGKTDSACLPFIQALPLESVAKPAFQLLSFSFELIEKPFVFGRVGALEIQLHTCLVF